MDRTTFLQRVFLMYPANVNENNMPFWIQAYEHVLNQNINYDKLFNVMISKYEYTHTAPSPRWFKENLSDCIIRDDKCAALKHHEALKNEKYEPMPEHVKQKLEMLKKKLSMGV